jgi:hypothetical protein
MTQMRKAFWKLNSGGMWMTSDRPAKVTIKEKGKKGRIYNRPSNASIQRLIKLSNNKCVGIELEDSTVVVYATIKLGVSK